MTSSKDWWYRKSAFYGQVPVSTTQISNIQFVWSINHLHSKFCVDLNCDEYIRSYASFFMPRVSYPLLCSHPRCAPDRIYKNKNPQVNIKNSKTVWFVILKDQSKSSNLHIEKSLLSVNACILFFKSNRLFWLCLTIESISHAYIESIRQMI